MKNLLSRKPSSFFLFFCFNLTFCYGIEKAPQKPQLLKILFLGHSNTGKTMMIKSLLGEEFSELSFPTIGIDIRSKILEGAKRIEFKLCEISSYKRDSSLRRFYLEQADGVVLLYDVNNRESFANLSEWLTEINRKPFVLFGNKADKGEKAREVSKEEALAFARQQDCPYYEGSMKEGFSVDHFLFELSQHCLETNRVIH